MTEIAYDMAVRIIVDDRGVLLDRADLDLVAGLCWRLSEASKSPQRFYAYTHHNKQRVYLHRLIAGAVDGCVVDHANGNSLDNRRVNLRICTPSLNNANQLRRPPASGYKGVYANPNRKSYAARISINGKFCGLGTFNSAIEAARAYDTAATKAFGEFAVLNFPRNDALGAA